MNKQFSTLFLSTRFLFFFFFSLTLLSAFLLFSLTQTVHAQLSGCAEIDMGNPGPSSAIPSPCQNNKGGSLSSVPLYKQWDPRWAKIPFGNCGPTATIQASGCGPTSLAMVISYWTKKQVLPPQTAKQSIHVCGLGTAYSSLISVPELYGLTSKVVSWTEAKRYLQQGMPIINVQKAGYFTGGGHYIVVTGINSDGTYAINDPDGLHRTQATEAQITGSLIESWVITK